MFSPVKLSRRNINIVMYLSQSYLYLLIEMSRFVVITNNWKLLKCRFVPLT